jgi:hypothetical protein
VPGPLIALSVLAGMLMLLNVPTMGGAGVLFALAAAPVVEFVRGGSLSELLAPGSFLSTMIFYGFSVPVALPILYLISMPFPKLNRWQRATVVLAGTYAWSVIVLVLMTMPRD